MVICSYGISNIQCGSGVNLGVGNSMSFTLEKIDGNYPFHQHVVRFNRAAKQDAQKAYEEREDRLNELWGNRLLNLLSFSLFLGGLRLIASDNHTGIVTVERCVQKTAPLKAIVEDKKSKLAVAIESAKKEKLSAVADVKCTKSRDKKLFVCDQGMLDMTLITQLNLQASRVAFNEANNEYEFSVSDCLSEEFKKEDDKWGKRRVTFGYLLGAFSRYKYQHKIIGLVNSTIAIGIGLMSDVDNSQGYGKTLALLGAASLCGMLLGPRHVGHLCRLVPRQCQKVAHCIKKYF